MRQEMADVNWAYLDGFSIDESWQFIKCNIHQCAQKNIPKYTILNTQRSPIWMTKKAIEAVRAKARAYKTYRKTNSHSMLLNSSACAMSQQLKLKKQRQTLNTNYRQNVS